MSARAGTESGTGAGAGARARGEILRVIMYIALGVGVLVSIYPFYWMLTAATVEESRIFDTPPRLFPGGRLFENLGALGESVPYVRALINSIVVSSITTASTVLLSALAGYAFAKFRFRGKGIMFAVVIGTIALPLEILVVPMFVIMVQFGWVDTYLALIVPFLVTGFGVFLMRQQMMGFPDDLLDAARIDGAGEVGIFFRVVLPNMRAACAALAIVTFMSQWGNFLWPLVVISSEDLYTYPLMLSTLVQGDRIIEYGPVMAGALIGLVPLAVVFILFQKYLVSGVFGGSLKE